MSNEIARIHEPMTRWCHRAVAMSRSEKERVRYVSTAINGTDSDRYCRVHSTLMGANRSSPSPCAPTTWNPYAPRPATSAPAMTDQVSRPDSRPRLTTRERTDPLTPSPPASTTGAVPTPTPVEVSRHSRVRCHHEVRSPISQPGDDTRGEPQELPPAHGDQPGVAGHHTAGDQPRSTREVAQCAAGDEGVTTPQPFSVEAAL